MNCQEIKKLLIPFLDSELSEKERAIINTHLHACKSCQKEKELLERTWSMLDGLRAPKVSSNFTANLMTKIREKEQKRPKFIFVFPDIHLQFALRKLAPVLATICILIVSYLFVQNYLIREQQVAKDFSPEQESIMQAKKDISVESEADVAKVAPIEREEITQLAAIDEEIIRYLDVYENIEFYQNYGLVDDFDIVENLDEGTL